MVKKIKNVGADLCVCPSEIDHVQIEVIIVLAESQILIQPNGNALG